ncbi:YhgE/Pip domain-containing protein [Bifidobacterium leontopitheci]|uniref:ABC-2 family transporter protein n=1 Tax=Bifidobacterium leontopitheci TaxID=2650774 RepID=A0A6I1GMQ1_9BIFI|nr:YhgE/Pip domain-containing protein [Bifidobacterium leontopitheci]KAB7790617.1 ABC-2 family transporter protein [Bifidobacterium leontopitheci]
MKNVLRIVRRDILRLLRVPTAWVIMVGLIMIPPMYAWFNIIGFWNPYGNTGNITIDIANEDRGASNATLGDLKLGDQIVDQLKANDQLGWRFVTSAKALSDVQSGRSYAAIVIPKDFSESLAGVVTDSGKRPQLKYYVNEKINAVSPKITDTGASTLDSQINSTFVSTVSEVLSGMVNTIGDQINAKADAATAKAIAELESTDAKITKIRSSITDLTTSLQAVPRKTAQTRRSVAQAQSLARQASATLNGISSLTGDTRTALTGFAGTSSAAFDRGSNLLSQVSAKANTSIAAVTGSLSSANGTVAGTLATLNQLNKDTQEVIDLLNRLPVPPTSLIEKLTKQNSDIAASIDRMTTLNRHTGDTIDAMSKTADSANTATQQSLAAAGKARDTLASASLPQLDAGVDSLTDTAGTVSSGLSSQSTLTTQIGTMLDQIDSAVASTVSVLRQTDKGLASLEPRLETLSTDLATLSSSNVLSDLLGTDGKLDVASISNFMMSPTVLDTKTLYPVGTYGSGMAPLFACLSLWVGAFAFVVIVKLEVDDEDLPFTPTAGERYCGRFLLLSLLSVLQGVVVPAGNLIIGVQTANPFMYVLTGVACALTFLCIIYALSSLFMHVGKALCVLLIIVQIPGGSGVYPIEMMPRFFRVLYPLFPFRYAINAFRETIGGFYGLTWLKDVGILALFAVVFFTVGLAARPLMANLNRLFARQIAESDMIVGEPVHLPGDGFRVSQMIRALADRDEYRAEINRRAQAFALRYPRLRRGALVTGIVVPAVLVTVFALTPGVKLVALATWIVWILLILGFLMVIELMRDSFERQAALGTLSDESIRAMLYERKGRGGRRERGDSDTKPATAARKEGHTA